MILGQSYQTFRRDFRIRYRRAYLGIFWAVAPTILIGITAYILVLQFGFEVSGSGLEYPVYLCVGLYLWTAFSEGVIGPLQMMRRLRTVVTKGAFSYYIIVGASFFWFIFKIILMLPVLIIVLFFYNASYCLYVPYILFFSIILFMLSSSMGSILSSFSVIFLDIRYSIQFLLIALMFFSGVFFEIPFANIFSIFECNPVYYIIKHTRAMLTGQPIFEIGIIFYSFSIIFLFFVSMKYFLFTIRKTSLYI